MKKTTYILLCIGLVLSIGLFIGCKNTPKDTNDSSPQPLESSNGNEIELPDVEL